MSDLTRRVLEADRYMDRSPVTDWNKFDDARRILEDAAPILARQVEAVEALADELEDTASIELRTLSGEVLDAGYAEALRYAAARLRDAHTEAEK